MTRPDKITVLLADDHLVVRMGIASILSFDDRLDVVGEASDGETAVRLAQSLKPDVVVMDLMMPRLDGAEATAAIRRTCPGTKILILTSFPGAPELSAALKAGANGALAKTSTQAELTRAIHAIAIGERIVADEIEAQRRFEQSLPPLTPARLEVLSLLSKGLSNQDIGRILNISPNSVKDRLKLTFARLGVANRTEAVAFALRQNLLG